MQAPDIYFSKTGNSLVPDVCLSPIFFATFIHFSMSFFAVFFLRIISLTKKQGLKVSIALKISHFDTPHLLYSARISKST